MKCKRCGRENPSNVKRCIYCNTPFYGNYSNINMPQNRKQHSKKKKELKNKKTDNVIIALIIALALVFTTLVGVYAFQNFVPHKKGFRSGGGGGGGISASSYTPNFDNEDKNAVLERIKEINEGIMPEITYDADGIPSFIDGKYSNLRVTDYRTAISSLQDIKGLMNFDNPLNEYVGIETYTFDSNKFYRLQQVVNEIPVYDKQIVIETNSSGVIKCLSSGYDAGLSSITTTPIITKEEAEHIALSNSNSENTNIVGCELNIYTINGQPTLSWVIEYTDGMVERELLILSAVDGSVLDGVSLVNEMTATGLDLNGNTREFDVSRVDGTYQMSDSQRGIAVYECNNSKTGNLITSSDNNWNNASAVTAMSDVKEIVDFYSNVLNTRAFKNGHLKQIQVFINYKKGWFKYNNAFSSTSQDDLTKTILVFGNGDSYVNNFDVTAHELTHAVVAVTVNGGLNYLNQSGAINESYADIIGNLIQNEIKNQTEWDIGENLSGGAIRSLSNPNKHRQPDKIGGKYMTKYCYSNHSHSGCDRGGVHTNSGVLNKAAYLMHQNGLNDKRELATLFCRSLNYMTPTTDFLNCRAALLRAGKDMGMTEEKISIINNALKEVGIYNTDNENITNRDENSSGLLKGTLSGKVADANTQRVINGVEIVASNGNVSGTAHSDSNGNFSVKLKEGTYKLVVSASGYLSCEINNVNIKKLETTYLENTILLKEIGDAPLSQAGGMISNAVSGEAVENAIIKFRKNWGNKSGEYLKNSSNSVVTIKSNNEGKYYIASLEYGYYTMEVAKDGYATQYVNIIASNQNSNALNQNVVLVPEANGNDFRITLEWDENPRDEDAHIIGDVPGEFHVYYRNKTANINGETIATLDHDDTQGNGFETVTLKANNSGTYKYYVYHYAGTGSLATSNAKVKIYQGDVMIKQYNVPVDQGIGKYWNVFNIVNGEVVTINRISDSDNQ